MFPFCSITPLYARAKSSHCSFCPLHLHNGMGLNISLAFGSSVSPSLIYHYHNQTWIWKFLPIWTFSCSIFNCLNGFKKLIMHIIMTMHWSSTNPSPSRCDDSDLNQMELKNILIVPNQSDFWPYAAACIIIIHCSFIGQRRTAPRLSLASPKVLFSSFGHLFTPLLPLAWFA